MSQTFETLRMMVLPMLGTGRKIASESDYVLYRNYLEHWKSQAFGHLILPTESEGVVDSENCRIWKLEKFGNLYDQQVKMTPLLDSMFHPMDGDYPVDVILTSRAVLATFLARLYWGKTNRLPPIPVVIIEPKAIDYSSTHNQVTEVELTLRALGYASSFTFFSTMVEKQTGLQMCRRYLSPSMVQRVDQNSAVLPLGIRCDQIDAARARTQRRKKFTCLFNGRLNTNKQWDWVADLYLDLYKSGADVNGVFVTPLDKKFDTRKYPGLTVVSGLSRDEFLRMLCSCHVAVNHSKEEGLSVGLLEQMYSGLIVFLPMKEWVRGMLGSFYDKYPFLYDTHTNVYSRLKEIMADYPAAAAKMEPVREYLKATYDDAHVCRTELDVIRRWVRKNQDDRSISEDVQDLIRRAADGLGDGFNFSKLTFTVKQMARQPACVYNRNSAMVTFPAKQQIFRWMLDNGWSDTMASADPVMMRRKGDHGQEQEQEQGRKARKEAVPG